MEYTIQCTVSGGVTGHRSAPLKVDGQIQVFPDRQAAEAVAARLREQMNGNPHRTATFWYTVQENEEL